MSTETISETPAEDSEDNSAAYKEAAVELGKGIALGLVPFLGQAIDVYDTIASSVTLYQSKSDEDKENAQFDLLLAIVGWIPGPGDGIKKSLRIVNQNPDRFAPVLFDLLRHVLQECGVHTSPEALLDEIFNASKLSAQLEKIIEGVKDASAFEALPETAQTAVLSTLQTAQSGLPLMVGVVEKRLKKWKPKQPNSSASRTTGGRAKNSQPGAKDAGTQGNNRAAQGAANDASNEKAATLEFADVSNEILGVSGEHIADYICAYTFGWGEKWRQHDDGTQGKWVGEKPGKDALGKLSKGGKPKLWHALYKLSDGANGTGIDAVWRAKEDNNGGKPYAIVEAKASREEDGPKFLRKNGNTRKPSFISKLGVSGIIDPDELLEPLEIDPESKKNKGGSGKTKGKTHAAASPNKKTKTKTNKTKKPKNKKPILVQMSREWIDENIDDSVKTKVSNDIKKLGKYAYSRHLFFSAPYKLALLAKDGASKAECARAHLLARKDDLPADQHETHDAFHYDDDDIKKAVNKRKEKLREIYKKEPTLDKET